MSAPFDEVEAASKLGFPGQKFESIIPDTLEGLYWVTINSIQRPLIVVNGHGVTDTGYAVAMAWLRRVAAHGNPQHDVWYVSKVLRWYDALPIGWNENSQSDPSTGERGHVTFSPIEVRLVTGNRVAPQARNPMPVSGAPGEPTRQPNGPSVGPPPHMQPGYSPPQPSRATLREIDGKLTWILEAYDLSRKQWYEELRDPAE